MNVLKSELYNLINKYICNNIKFTPMFIRDQCLTSCLNAFTIVLQQRKLLKEKTLKE